MHVVHPSAQDRSRGGDCEASPFTSQRLRRGLCPHPACDGSLTLELSVFAMSARRGEASRSDEGPPRARKDIPRIHSLCAASTAKHCVILHQGCRRGRTICEERSQRAVPSLRDWVTPFERTRITWTGTRFSDAPPQVEKEQSLEAHRNLVGPIAFIQLLGTRRGFFTFL